MRQSPLPPLEDREPYEGGGRSEMLALLDVEASPSSGSRACPCVAMASTPNSMVKGRGQLLSSAVSVASGDKKGPRNHHETRRGTRAIINVTLRTHAEPPPLADRADKSMASLTWEILGATKPCCAAPVS